MIPRLDVFIQSCPRTLRGLQLPRCQQLVVLLDVPQFHPFGDQLLASNYLPLRRLETVEGTNEGDSDAPGVVPVGVGAFGFPTSTFVGLSVAPYEEVVTDVPPVPAFDVERLDESHVEDALSLRRTVFCGGVQDYYVWYWHW
jgi:hypothetical protein